MPKTTRVAIIVSALSCAALAACAPAGENSGPAKQLASLYVTLDTLGDRDAADTLVTSCGDDASSAELISPTTSVFVGNPLKMPGGADTTQVLVMYRVLGIAHPEDAKVVGPQYWRFSAAPRTDTVVLRMAPDSAGRLWIACGPFHPDHAMLSELGEAIGAMDSASLAELELAKQGKRSAPPESK